MLSDSISFRLPNAPSLRYYCVYGHGKETEVSAWLTTKTRTLTKRLRSEVILVSRGSWRFSFWHWHGLTTYRYTSELNEDGETSEAVDLEAGSKDDTISSQDLHSSRDIPFSRSWIDREHTDESSHPRVCLFNSLHGADLISHSHVNAGSQRCEIGRR